jgi:hypothetical protein
VHGAVRLELAIAAAIHLSVIRYMRFTWPILVASIVLIAVGCARGSDQPEETGAPASRPTTTSSDAVLDASRTVTEHGIGRLRAGMTIAEGTRVVPGLLALAEGADTVGCAYLEWHDGPVGVSVMIEGGRIARIDVDSATVATAAGARVGDREERIQNLYAGRVTVSPHKYTDGHVLTVVPADPADSAFRIVFETENGRVVRYRAGRRPPVEYVERCG